MNEPTPQEIYRGPLSAKDEQHLITALREAGYTHCGRFSYGGIEAAVINGNPRYVPVGRFRSDNQGGCIVEMYLDDAPDQRHKTFISFCQHYFGKEVKNLIEPKPTS